MPHGSSECLVTQLWVNLRSADKMTEPAYQVRPSLFILVYYKYVKYIKYVAMLVRFGFLAVQ